MTESTTITESTTTATGAAAASAMSTGPFSTFPKYQTPTTTGATSQRYINSRPSFSMSQQSTNQYLEGPVMSSSYQHAAYGGGLGMSSQKSHQRTLIGSATSPGYHFSSSAAGAGQLMHSSSQLMSRSVVGGGTSSINTGGTTRTYLSGSAASTQRAFGGMAMEETRTTSGGTHFLSERVVEHEVRVPKKVVREDIVEKVIIVPEKILHEEVVEDIQMIRQKIIEFAKPIYQERIVEVPEIQYVERIVEVPEVVYQEKIREVPKIEIQERIVEIPTIITQEKIVEVPEIEYREVPYEKIVEIPEVREQVVLRQIPVPQYIDKPVPEHVTVEVEQEVTRNVPVPLESVTTIELKVPRLRPRYTKVDVPLYVPRFIEVAMPAELIDAQATAQSEHYASQVAVIASQPAASLCEVERLAGTIRDMDYHYSNLIPRGEALLHEAFAAACSSGRFHIENLDSINMLSSKITGMDSARVEGGRFRATSTTTTTSNAKSTGFVGTSATGGMGTAGLASNNLRDTFPTKLTDTLDTLEGQIANNYNGGTAQASSQVVTSTTTTTTVKSREAPVIEEIATESVTAGVHKSLDGAARGVDVQSCPTVSADVEAHTTDDEVNQSMVTDTVDSLKKEYTMDELEEEEEEEGMETGVGAADANSQGGRSASFNSENDRDERDDEESDE